MAVSCEDICLLLWLAEVLVKKEMVSVKRGWKLCPVRDKISLA
jgi:hypothetical protein